MEEIEDARRELGDEFPMELRPAGRGNFDDATLSRSQAIRAAERVARFATERERLERTAPAPESIVVDPETEARLKSLGYL